jgi:hypothetical protein
MLRVIFTLIVITFLFPASIYLLIENYIISPFTTIYGLVAFLFGLLVCIPLTFCCIALKWVKPWQFMLAGSIIGIVWSIKLGALRVEFLALVGTAIFCSALTFVFWVLAFWKNPEFTHAVKEAQQVISKP